MKNFKLLSLLALMMFAFTSCDETDEIPEYGNWRERNEQFIDSIATVARTNADGAWKVFLADGLNPEKEWGNEYYVYCNVLQAGDGTVSPAFTDSVLLNYKGRLIPSKSYPDGYVFDGSYDGELEPEFDVPVKFKLSGTVKGFYTAVQHMVAGTTNGDIWRVYIPSELAYGSNSYSGIPAYSALIFDINLVDFTSAGEPFKDHSAKNITDL